ncbi:MAG: dioxygenase [Variovorax sp.]|nr:dioxygenase [Variovorax sp.]
MMDEMNGRYDRLAAALRQIPHQVGATPRAVLMVSAHWEEDEFTAMSHRIRP